MLWRRHSWSTTTRPSMRIGPGSQTCTKTGRCWRLRARKSWDPQTSSRSWRVCRFSSASIRLAPSIASRRGRPAECLYSSPEICSSLVSSTRSSSVRYFVEHLFRSLCFTFCFVSVIEVRWSCDRMIVGRILGIRFWWLIWFLWCLFVDLRLVNCWLIDFWKEFSWI